MIGPRPRILTASVLALLVACAADHVEAPSSAHVVTDLVVPRGVLDRATTLDLEVYEGEVGCDLTRGKVTFPADSNRGRTVLRARLGNSGCAEGVLFCGDVSVPKSAALRVFSATAKATSGATVAVGCATATVDRDALPLELRMFRFVPEAVCGDGELQPTEQCERDDAEAGALCDDACQTKELLVSVGSAQNFTQTGGEGDKADAALLWPTGTGTGGRAYAFFTDRAVSGGTSDVGLRALGDGLAPLTTPPALAAGSIFLPNGGTFPPSPSSRAQGKPQAAAAGGNIWVAFEDDDTPGSNGIDIHLRSMDDALVAGQTTAIGVNGPGGAGEPAVQAAPSIAAGPRDRLYVAWEDRAQGRIVGRTMATDGTRGNQNDLSSGTGNGDVSVAATPNGWVAVWRGPTGIKLRALNEDGTPQGAEQVVSDVGGGAARPRVASLPDGRFAVVWSAASDVYFQRYDARGAKVAGDQATALNDRVADDVQSEPAIAGTPAVGGSFVVAWADASTGHVRARMLGGTSGFLFNPVTGLASEFQASRDDGRVRSAPVVAVGGRGPFVAIGWEDRTSPGAGVVVRRFPLPVE